MAMEQLGVCEIRVEGQSEEEYEDAIKQELQLMKLMQEKEKSRMDLERWEQKLVTYLDQKEDTLISEEELLNERICNLTGIMLGCQQQLDEIDLSIKRWRKSSMEGAEKVGTPVEPTVKVLQEAMLFRDEATYPGIIFHETATREALTSEEKKLNYEKEMGISLHIPENAIGFNEATNIVIQPSFSGPFSGPAHLEPVSPAYLVKKEGEVQLQKEITVKIQHNANIETKEDCKDLFFLKADLHPSYRGPLFGPMYIFHVIDRNRVTFSLDNPHFGEAIVNDLSWFMIWRKSPKIGLNSGNLSLYSARLYKGSKKFRNRAVFCMCQQHPQLTRLCDEIIAKTYSNIGITTDPEGRITKDAVMFADGTVTVSLDGECADEEKKEISKWDVDLPKIMNVHVHKFQDYPPRIPIHLGTVHPSMWTLDIQGLTEDVALTVLYEEDESALPAPRVAKQPTLKTLSLIKWTDEQGQKQTFSLIDRVHVKWRKFGTILGIPVHKKDGWDLKYHRDAEQCWKKTMDYWLKKKSLEYPVTWEGLDTMLLDLGLEGVAKDLKEAVATFS